MLSKTLATAFFLAAFTKSAFTSIPIVVNTWNFPSAGGKAWESLANGSSAVTAVVDGCTVCEMDELECGYSVGYGGKPDEDGETTLDAMIFDGSRMDMGAVGRIRNMKNAIGVARHIMDYTDHSFIIGGAATVFGAQMGFPRESLTTNYSYSLWQNWTAANCQPNFWKNVEPDPNENCGPYSKSSENSVYYNKNNNNNRQTKQEIGSENHDTIGMIAIDSDGNIAAGTSTNGLTYKIGGRVGDSPLPGAGGYAENEIGAAVATGDGDIMMRFLPTFLAVEEMRRGSTPREATRTAVSRIAKYYPNFSGAVIAVNKDGEFAAACNGMTVFPYIVVIDGNVTLVNEVCVPETDSGSGQINVIFALYLVVFFSSVLLC